MADGAYSEEAGKWLSRESIPDPLGNSNMSGVWKCGFCFGAFICLLLSELLNHLYVYHKDEGNFHISCGIQGCQNSYRIYNSLYKHVRSKHVAFLNIPANALTADTGIDFDLVLQPHTHAVEASNHSLENEVRFHVPLTL